MGLINMQEPSFHFDNVHCDIPCHIGGLRNVKESSESNNLDLSILDYVVRVFMQVIGLVVYLGRYK